MAGSLNKVMVIGNLGRDAELRYTPGGAAVASFSMAATETWKDKEGQKQERTEWVRCVLWGKRAEALSEYLTKGKTIYVEGKMATRKWQDKDGNDKYTTEVRVDDVVLLGGGGQRGEGGGGGQRQSRGNTGENRSRQQDSQDDGWGDGDAGGGQATTELTDDDIPF